LENWELFLEWLIGMEAGGWFQQAHPEIVARWLDVFNWWCLVGCRVR
jgi:hypothetical protein